VIPSQAFTIASRVIRQLIRDRRTMVLIVAVPLVVMTLIGLSFPESNVLDYIAPALLAALALFFSFLLTGISFLRERSQGTMERLMASPVSRLDIVVGYLFGFFIFALTPLPDDLLFIPLGIMRYNLPKTLLAAFFGKLVMLLIQGVLLIM